MCSNRANRWSHTTGVSHPVGEVISNRWNFAVATCVALFLLARWAFTLPKAGVAREKAREVLNTLCAKPFASCAAVWHADWRAAGPATPLSAPSPTAVPVGIQKGQCRLRPLLGWFPGLLKVAQQEVPGAPGDLATLSLASLLCALVAENTTAALRAAASLACWMAACLEHSEWYASQSTDALQIPVLQGPSRRRHLDSAFKTQVAREAAQGHMGTSGMKIVRALRRFQNCGYSVADRPKDANSWNELVLAAYQQCRDPLPWDEGTVCILGDRRHSAGRPRDRAHGILRTGDPVVLLVPAAGWALRGRKTPDIGRRKRSFPKPETAN